MGNAQSKMLPTDATCCYYEPCNTDQSKHYCEPHCGRNLCVAFDAPHCCRHGFICICMSITADNLERDELVLDMKEKMTDETIIAVIKKYWDLPEVAGWTDIVETACGELEEIKELFPTKYLEQVEEIPKNLREYRDVVERAHEHAITYYESYEEHFSDEIGMP